MAAPLVVRGSGWTTSDGGRGRTAGKRGAEAEPAPEADGGRGTSDAQRRVHHGHARGEMLRDFVHLGSVRVVRRRGVVRRVAEETAAARGDAGEDAAAETAGRRRRDAEGRERRLARRGRPGTTESGRGAPLCCGGCTCGNC